MNTRLRCIVPAPSIANWRASYATWLGPASFPGRGEAYSSSRYLSIAELPISTVMPWDKAVHDRRYARLDVVAVGRAVGIGDVAAGAQTLTIWRAPPGAGSREFIQAGEEFEPPGVSTKCLIVGRSPTGGGER
jgi:hypothetical protein